jgi:hypothetical protein
LFNTAAVKAKYNVLPPYKVPDLTTNILSVRVETSLALRVVNFTEAF